MVYHLEGFVYESTAYEVIVNCLYNQLPDRPTTRHQCKTLLKSYVLALQYRITDLQDALVDCIRQYHREFTIAFEDLVWLINRLGHGEMIQKIPMVKYMIDQCAWEICSNGYKSFARQNPWFEPFLVLGDRPIRKVLFEAITEVSDHADPATGPNRYRVDDWVHFEQSAQNMTEFVELDD
ncbi:hypothetical protein A1O3_01784 [Capronia epimyces CBS 606.96]|uniref:BTB domain-containing protein n=1 Tax=Capronia epimyces CBS 606.96 TaxID=1182542 RepID=W9YJZ3_9EURO|nr:uncharacterized protein A1O3_01784 [Capronia epimyces CBS 606.96]EXJ93227.1 hypothetical protein A1O3_01784 [Capronia epimyces CBS 606.96]